MSCNARKVVLTVTFNQWCPSFMISRELRENFDFEKYDKPLPSMNLPFPFNNHPPSINPLLVRSFLFMRSKINKPPGGLIEEYSNKRDCVRERIAVVTV